MDSVRELRIFVAVADRGSLAAAARALRLSPPTVTRAVADLEARLGARLLDRSSRRCHTTEAGRRFAEDAREVLVAYDEAVGVAAGDAVAARGTVKVTAPLVFGREHVAPSLGRLVDQHAELAAELDLSDRQVDLHDEQFDLAVRIGAISDGSLIARRLGWVQRRTVASPAYLERHGTPVIPSDLSTHEVIHHGPGPGAQWTLRDVRGRPVGPASRSRLTINQADAAIAAALSGRGIVSVLSYQVFDALQSGSLVALLGEWSGGDIPVSLVWPESRQRIRRVRIAIDHLASELSAVPALASPSRPELVPS